MAEEHVIKVRRSKFHAVFEAVTSLEQATALVAARRSCLRKARHHCWACRVHDADGRLVEQARDDGEVGRPGHALLDLLRHGDIEGCVVVSRIYGGVKLGPGGVGRAVRDAGAAVLP